MTIEFKHLGKKGREFQGLEVIPLSGLNHSQIKFETSELTSYCPVTNQPDIYTLIVEVGPDGYSLETKSLKMYLETFREKAMFAEDLCSTICEDIFNATKPVFVRITLIQNIRGGIQLTVYAMKEELFNE